MKSERWQAFFDNFSKSGGTLRREEPLFRHTTWGVGGPAEFYCEPESLEELQKAVLLAGEYGIACLIIGAGSNLLIRDGGVSGMVIQTRKLQQYRLTDDGHLTAACGTWLPELARKTVEAGWAGLECLAGIPGTLGGAVVMNAGAHGQQISDHLERVSLLESGKLVRWNRQQLACGYRTTCLDQRHVVLEVEMNLSRGDSAELKDRLQHCREERKLTQSVGGPNAGSVFKNPPGMQAWKLIDKAGMRGARVAGAVVSEVHANFIVNSGGALAADILELIDQVQKKVKTCCDVELETEIRVIGQQTVTG